MIEKIRKSAIANRLSIAFLSKIYSIIISLISSVLIVRYLGPQRNGVYNYAIAYTTLFSGVATMGLDNVLIKEFSKENSDQYSLFLSSIVVRFVASLLSLLTLFASLWIFDIDKSQHIYILVASMPLLFNIFGAVSGWFYSAGRVKEVALIQSFTHTICLMLRLVCAWKDYGVIVLLIIQGLETLFLLTVLWIKYFKTYKKRSSKKQTIKNEILFLIRQGLPICIGSVAYTVFMKMDQVMIREMIGEYDLGIYSCAVQIAELWYFIPNTIMLVLLPELTKLYFDNNKTDFELLLQKSMSWFVLIGYGAALITTLVSKILIRIMYGIEYIEAAPILCIYIWAGVFINMSVLRGGYFVIKEWTECSLIVNLTGAISNIVLNYILIKIMGQMGAAVSTLVSFAIYAYFSSFMIPKLRKVGIVQTKALLLRRLR